MRTFLAADIETGVNEKIGKFTENLRRIDQNVKWVKPANNHLTIYFFGEIDETGKDVLEKTIQAAVEEIAPFSVSAGGLSAFPSMKRPRVFWTGIENTTGELNRIYEYIKNDLPLKSIKVNIETRDYTPHLTIGRVKGRCGEGIITELSSHREIEFGKFRIKSIVFYQSILRREGPLYKPIKIYEL